MRTFRKGQANKPIQRGVSEPGELLNGGTDELNEPLDVRPVLEESTKLMTRVTDVPVMLFKVCVRLSTGPFVAARLISGHLL